MFTLVIYGTKNSLPGVLAGKCDGSTCAVLKSDLSTVQTCFKDPSDVACTGTITEICITEMRDARVGLLMKLSVGF